MELDDYFYYSEEDYLKDKLFSTFLMLEEDEVKEAHRALNDVTSMMYGNNQINVSKGIAALEDIESILRK